MAAGQGFKTFATGDVLTAADTNGYLMQGVWVFANAAARTSAVTSPQEGNVSYLKDVDTLEIYNGTSWVGYGSGDITGVTAGTGISGGGTSGDVTVTNSMATAIDAKGDLVVGTGNDTFSRLAVGTNNQVLTADSTTATGLKWAAAAGGGKVLQVVQGTYSTITTIASTTMTDTGLSLAITPSATTSKILVMVNQQVEISRLASEIGCGVQLLRGATTVLTQAASYASSAILATGATEVVKNNIVSFNYLDSPATTSATTYKIQARASVTTNSGLVRAQGSSSTSIITLMEIGA